MTVKRGTGTLATAITIFAPSLVIPAFSYCLPTMKPVMFCKKINGDVLQENQRRLALSAQFHKVRGFEGAFGEQDAVIGNDSDRIPHQPRKAAHQCGAIEFFELVEAAAIH